MRKGAIFGTLGTYTDKNIYQHGTYRARRRGALPAEGALTARQWEALKTLFDNRCAYCRREPPPGKFLGMDHLVSFSKGGLHVWRNIVPACNSCNKRKGGSEKKNSHGMAADAMRDNIGYPPNWKDVNLDNLA